MKFAHIVVLNRSKHSFANPCVEAFTRQPGNDWFWREEAGLDLANLDIDLPFASLYFDGRVELIIRSHLLG